MTDQDLEARMREKARELFAAYIAPLQPMHPVFENDLCLRFERVVVPALLSVAREKEAELAQARADIVRLHLGIGLFVDAHTELEEEYKESLEIGDRIMTELDKARAEIQHWKNNHDGANKKKQAVSTLLSGACKTIAELRAEIDRLRTELKDMKIEKFN